MPTQTWTSLLNAGVPWQTVNGTALTSSASTATISPQAPTGQDFILPGQPNGLQWYPGMVLYVRFGGTLQAGATTSNLTMFLAIGVSGTLGTTLCTTGANTLGTTATTPVGYTGEVIVRCLAIGSTGNTLSAGGTIEFPTAPGANTANLGTPTANNIIMNLPETTAAFNTYTQGTAIGLRATLSAAFGSVVCNQFLVFQAC
jgi:hypothetical protein